MSEPSEGALRAVSILFGVSIDPARLDQKFSTEYGEKTVRGLATIIDDCMRIKDGDVPGVVLLLRQNHLEKI
jgi:hypothetical protein